MDKKTSISTGEKSSTTDSIPSISSSAYPCYVSQLLTKIPANKTKIIFDGFYSSVPFKYRLICPPFIISRIRNWSQHFKFYSSAPFQYLLICPPLQFFITRFKSTKMLGHNTVDFIPLRSSAHPCNLCSNPPLMSPSYYKERESEYILAKYFQEHTFITFESADSFVSGSLAIR